MIRASTDQAAMVNTELHWIPVAQHQPGRGQRVLLINKADGVARIGLWSPAEQVSHWQALPTFSKEEGQ